jgi:hypothetical protein
MRLQTVIFLTLLAAPAGPARAQWVPAATPQAPLPGPPPAPETLIIRGGKIIDGVSDRVVPNRGIVIRGGSFLEVNVDLRGRDLSGAQIIELRDDEYITPGFIDTHSHFEIDLFGKRMDEYSVNPIVTLANGVTTLFDAGESDPDGVFATRRRIDRGEQIGPRIVPAGPRIGIARQGPVPKTVQEMDALVDSLVERGAGGFKAKDISPPMLRELIKRAHMHGLTVAGHLNSGINNTTNPRDAILMGIDRVEHMLGGDALPADRDPYESLAKFDPYSKEGQDIIAMFLKYHVVWDPTTSPNGRMSPEEKARQPEAELKVYTPYIQQLVKLNPPRGMGTRWDSIRVTTLRSVKAFYDAGGTMTSGTDSPGRGNYLSGFQFHRELASFVEAGVPPAAVIKIATINGARSLNLGQKLGSIEPN